MTVSQRLRVSAAGLTALALLTAACGGGGSRTATTGGGTSMDQQLKLAECMRAHGVDMPDPKADQDAGGVTLDGRGMSPGKIEEAVKVCRAAAGIPPEKPVSQAEKDRRLAFARCMREHGVDMPDPSSDAGAAAALPLPSTGSQKETFDKAQRACASVSGSNGR